MGALLLVISPTMRCNLKCTRLLLGPVLEDRASSPKPRSAASSTSARASAPTSWWCSGGEPYLLKDMWLRLFRNYNDMYFLTFTNGTLFDQPTVDELARLGNVAPGAQPGGISRVRPTARRGAGVYDKVLAAHGAPARGGRAVRRQRHLHAATTWRR